MKKIYTITSILILTFTNICFTQEKESFEPNYSIGEQSNDIEIDDAKSHYQIIKLVDDLKETFDANLEQFDFSMNLNISLGNANNSYSISLKDLNGIQLLEGKINPNSINSIELRQYPAEGYLIRITDMSTFKTSVYKIQFS